ncbi:TIGR03085 family metal-binding protein [Nocardia veterana]|uniref:TIGR03085 family protein n=1 Tax=Nocardia veterana TaxID=132249 RepID=A0A7X6M4C4_9NOCA|nr:TIGR03085 family metal-binding protein [Nocardia veterana]NKY89579.1 TIGR03085 family protein [Nocardia veterana]
MSEVEGYDAQERYALCDLFVEVGPDASTLLADWTARDLAAHLLLRERDLLAGPCLVLPGPFQRFAQRRMSRLAERTEFGWLVRQLRAGPPPGVFRVRWMRSFPSLNEFFVHHEDLRRANGLGPRTGLAPGMESALWRNVRRSGHYLSRRVRGVALEIVWAGTGESMWVRKADRVVRLSGPPGELLLFLFGRQAVAHVDLSGPKDAVAVVRRSHFGM